MNRGRESRENDLDAQPVSGRLSTQDQSTEDRRVAAVRKEKKKRTGVLITDQAALRGEPANRGGAVDVVQDLARVVGGGGSARHQWRRPWRLIGQAIDNRGQCDDLSKITPLRL